MGRHEDREPYRVAPGEFKHAACDFAARRASYVSRPSQLPAMDSEGVVAPRKTARTRRRSSGGRKTARRADPPRRRAATGRDARTAKRSRTATSRARSARKPTSARVRSAARETGPALATHEPIAGAPNAIGLIRVHVSYNSHEMDQVRRFYTETLGFTRFDGEPASEYLWIQTGGRSSIGFSAPEPGPPEQWRPPREPSLYLIVSDVDRAHLELTERGATFEQGPTDMPWRHRVATLRDPEGRLVCLAQVIEPTSRGETTP
jgi:lactoylglutathione lyase